MALCITACGYDCKVSIWKLSYIIKNELSRRNLANVCGRIQEMVQRKLEFAKKAIGEKDTNFATVATATSSLVNRFILARGNVAGNLQDKDGHPLYTSISK